MLELLLNDFPHIHILETDSTNRFSMDLASKTTPKHGFCVYADYQTAGKGQFGSTWESERGLNILSSFILLSPKVDIDNMFSIHLWITNSLIEALKKIVDLEFQIKWPNDILIHHKKLAGILIENSFKGTELNYCVAGIGINVHQEIFSTNYDACSLKSETGKEYSIEKILHTIQKCILSNEYMLLKKNISNASDLYNKYLYRKNKTCAFKTKEGEVFEAKILHVDIDGQLVVEIKEKRMRFAHRDIRMVNK